MMHTFGYDTLRQTQICKCRPKGIYMHIEMQRYRETHADSYKPRDTHKQGDSHMEKETHVGTY
jgi:hypothetical protein